MSQITVDLLGNGRVNFIVSDVSGSSTFSTVQQPVAFQGGIAEVIQLGRTEGKFTIPFTARIRFGRREEGPKGPNTAGIGIPPNAIIESASLTLHAKDTTVTNFAPDFFLISRDGRWDSYGSEQWVTQGSPDFPGQTTIADFEVIVEGPNDDDVLYETDATPSVSEGNRQGQFIDAATERGSIFTIASGTAATDLARVGVWVFRPSAPSASWNSWIEIYKMEPGQRNPSDPGSVFLGKSDSKVYSTFPLSYTVVQYFDFSTTVTVSGNSDSEGVYFWNFHLDKPEPFDSANTRLDLGFTAPHNSHTDLVPAVSGILQDGFSADHYLLTSQLPHQGEIDFGSVIGINLPAWDAVDTPFTTSGLETLIQEWVDADDYDPDAPVCLGIGLGNSVPGTLKVAYGTSSSGHGFDPKLSVTYRPRRTQVV